MNSGIDSSLCFFEEAHKNFSTALSQVGEIRRFYRVAGSTFCLRFAGSAMVDALTPALNHLEVAETEDCDLMICIWDSVSTQTSPVQFPWTDHSCALRGEVWEYNTHRIYTVVDIHTKVLHLFDTQRNIALYWIRDQRELPWWIGGSPLQLILHWWMRARGHQLTHAAAVGYPEGGVLFAGKSGAGKSTTALACMKGGMKYVSEDYCVVGDLPDIWVYSIYNSAKIGGKTLDWFPELEKQVENRQRAEGDKAFLFHHKFQPEKILPGFPLKALFTLKVEETKDSWLEPVDSRETLTALSVSTMWQLTHTGPAVFKHLQRVAEALPCYKLHLGRDLMQIPRLVEKIL